MRWFDDRRVHLAAFSSCIAAFVAALVGMRRGRASARAAGWRSNVHRRVVALTAISGLSFLVFTGALLATADVWEFQYGVPARVRVMLWLAFPVVALAVASAASGALVIAAREGTASWRVRCLAQAAAATLFVGLLAYWRLL